MAINRAIQIQINTIQNNKAHTLPETNIFTSETEKTICWKMKSHLFIPFLVFGPFSKGKKWLVSGSVGFTCNKKAWHVILQMNKDRLSCR